MFMLHFTIEYFQDDIGPTTVIENKYNKVINLNVLMNLGSDQTGAEEPHAALEPQVAKAWSNRGSNLKMQPWVLGIWYQYFPFFLIFGSQSIG